MVSLVAGMQWGDEGKAKVIDYFAEDFDYVIRFQGGANAGHTVITGEKKYVFHLIPSGILRPACKVVIGNGVVLDPEEFLKELDMISGEVSTEGRVFISDRAHLVMPYHKLMDRAKEESSKQKIGTTLRGIGPAYIDKVSRIGIRVCDLYQPGLKDKIRCSYEMKEFLLKNYYHIENTQTIDEMFDSLQRFADRLKKYTTDTERIIHDAYKAGKNILFEGAQGTLLDVDFGTYPFVTGSNTAVGGALTGSGCGFMPELKIVGIVKAYTTRVGEGPFPTEDKTQKGDKLRELGKEFGSTTGRPRRCGWLDLPLLNYAFGINGTQEIFLTKLDVLDESDEIQVCVAYKLDGVKLETPPATAEELSRVEPVYETLPGWKSKTFGIRKTGDLPDNAQKYIEYIEQKTGVKIKYISTGYERADVIVRG